MYCVWLEEQRPMLAPQTVGGLGEGSEKHQRIPVTLGDRSWVKEPRTSVRPESCPSCLVYMRLPYLALCAGC